MFVENIIFLVNILVWLRWHVILVDKNNIKVNNNMQNDGTVFLT